MNPHNMKAEAVLRDAKIRTATAREDIQVLRSTLVESSTLAVADDVETGGDPYNSTGRHVIIKPLDD